MASLYRLDVIVRGNSTITQDGAVKWTKDWVNRRQESDKNKDDNGNYVRQFYADLFDSRISKAWKIFSDVAADTRKIENTYITQDNEEIKGVIFTSPFLIGKTEEVIVDTADGTKYISYQNNNAKIFLQVEDSLKAVPRVENQTNDGFQIVLYDGEYYDEDKVKLDCSENPIKVNLAIFE